ncbi:hypothetical protein H310_08397 [Aphanomyces invadans]|uniref:BZIP domain-containing protein n=1 Tax=Aphanomyces invadans TaxID=157072 RepID=A0A024U011_9STRA|nr:hypothetical protein H310_08397 [Aphanomyces invadans]ETV98907.1 hypothetical protein H310_08397 [Aphanomyces invadans]|eukprot:XP_008872336.1 hypothetical protein H310_08397 [Aphanomyces invadans]
MSKITKPKKNYLYSPYDMQVENADEDDMMDPVLSGLPSNLTRNLWDDWNDDSALQDDTTLANFASGMDMTYVEDVDKQPPASSDSLLDSLMAEGNVKAETGYDDMMSPPTSLRNFTAQDVADMMLLPSALGNPASGMTSKDTRDSTSTAQSNVRRASNPSPHANHSAHFRGVKDDNVSGGRSAPISPPHETIVSMPTYSLPTPASVNQPSATSSFSANSHQPNMFNAMGQPFGEYSTMQQGSGFQSNGLQLPTSATNMHHGSSFGSTMHQQPSPQHNGFPSNSANGQNHGQFGMATPQHILYHPMPPSQTAPPSGTSNSLAGMGTSHPSGMFGPSSSPSLLNNMMMPPGFMMYNQGPYQMHTSPQHFASQTGNSNMMLNSFMNMPSMMGVGGMSSLPPASLPFAIAMPLGLGASAVATATPLIAKPPLKSHVPLARKPGTGEISSMLQSLLDEEAEKRDKKLERNRDSARESRKKQQKYVEVLEDGIQSLQISKESLLRFRFGRSPMVPPQQLELMCGLRPHVPSFATVMHAARQRRMLGHPKHPILDKVFTALARTMTLLQASLLDMYMLWDAASNGLANVLRLSPAQVQQIQDFTAGVRRREMTRLVLLVKAFKALRRQAFELGAFAPSLDVYFRAVLTPDQMAKLVTWSESNRSELLRLQWMPSDNSHTNGQPRAVGAT